MKHKCERGQAILLVVVAMGIFLVGAAGLAIDGAQLYAHREMAQVAADSAAQAAIMSIFDATNATATNPFSTAASFTCATADLRTPCVYARNNGFGGTGSDTVTVDFPTSAPGVGLSGDDAVNLVRVTVQRTLSNSLMRLLGATTTTVKAVGTAAIVDVVSPTPILVTHPTKSGALDSNGNPGLKICGGPIRSIQVNSSSATAVSMNSNTTVDLSKAGPLGGTGCSTGTGADFGVFGGPNTAGMNFVPGTLPGKYIQPASPILDPLAKINPPTTTGLTVQPVPIALANGTNGCPASPGKACKLYSPGLYNDGNGIGIKNETAVFKPGVYYIAGGGFSNAANGDMFMSTGFPDDPDTGQGMLVYNTGAGTFDVGANSNATLVGSCDTLTCNKYKGILFFEDRSAPAQPGHSLGGNGCISLIGTLYITNTAAIMTADATHYQGLSLQGTPCSGTNIQGEIITGTLHLGGNASITMALNPAAVLHIRQVALVK